MIIKKVAFGNEREAYIESNFSEGLNIIFSNDNNKGKTLVMQGLMYSLGNEGIFPSGFSNGNYYFYTQVLIGNLEYEFLRKGNSIIVKYGEAFEEFNNIRDYKHFFDKNINNLPKIIKDGNKIIVDPTMFYELFFLGQDNRDTSNLISKGYHKKNDFLDMIYYLKDCNTEDNTLEDIKELKEEKILIEVNIKKERKKLSILKDNPALASFATNTGDSDQFNYISKTLSEIHNHIFELRKKRSREENRKIKLENLISELISLNLQIEEGKVICSDCGSDNITYTNKDFKFEITNDYVKNNIKKSIKNNILLKKELIESYTNEINLGQLKINNLLNNGITPEIKDYFIFNNEIRDTKQIDIKISELKIDLDKINAGIKAINEETSNKKKTQTNLIKKIVENMQKYYSIIDPEGKLDIDDLFTKKGITYSGSEGQEYYFCRIMSLNKILGHNYPIIIDGFREGEVSTTKEQLMLKEFLKLQKQVILTSTLKDEEFDANKYYNIKGLNAIDYSQKVSSKILNIENVEDFLAILNNFHIKI